MRIAEFLLNVNYEFAMHCEKKCSIEVTLGNAGPTKAHVRRIPIARDGPDHSCRPYCRIDRHSLLGGKDNA